MSRTYPVPDERIIEGAGMAEDPWVHRSGRMRCSTCMFFVLKDRTTPAPHDAVPLGRCRRHSPTMAGFPVVFITDWCGDHKLDEEKA